MHETRDKLLVFFRRTLARISGVTRVELRCSAVGQRAGRPVGSFPLPEASEENIAVLVQDIQQAAQNHADSVGTVTRFEVQLISERNGSDDPVGVFPFRLRARDEIAEIDGSETPTERGLVSQLMRHLEATQRLFHQATGVMLTTQAQRIEQDALTINRLIAEREQHFRQIEDAKSMEAEREIKMLEHVARKEQIDWGLSKLNQLLPVIMSKLSGAPIANPAELNLLRTFVSGLSQAQLSAMASQLSSEQQVVFFTMLRQLAKEGKDSNPTS